MTALHTAERRIAALLEGTVLLIGLALVVLAGLVVAAIPVGLALLFMAFARVWRGLGNACAGLFGRHSPPPKAAA